jgi:hypothetical protein
VHGLDMLNQGLNRSLSAKGFITIIPAICVQGDRFLPEKRSLQPY